MIDITVSVYMYRHNENSGTFRYPFERTEPLHLGGEREKESRVMWGTIYPFEPIESIF